MNNKEFFELSKIEVKKLNSSESKESQEAWRSGYNYARNFVRKCLNTYYMDECISKLEGFSEKDLENFE